MNKFDVVMFLVGAPMGSLLARSTVCYARDEMGLAGWYCLMSLSLMGACVMMIFFGAKP